jgi:predicted RNase H-like HicB family nuclease
MGIQLTIVYERGEDGFWIAEIPEIPGAFSQGHTRDEAREMVLDAAEGLATVRRELALKDRGPLDQETLSFAA